MRGDGRQTQPERIDLAGVSQSKPLRTPLPQPPHPLRPKPRRLASRRRAAKPAYLSPTKLPPRRREQLLEKLRRPRLTVEPQLLKLQALLWLLKGKRRLCKVLACRRLPLLPRKGRRRSTWWLGHDSPHAPEAGVGERGIAAASPFVRRHARKALLL